MISRNAGSRWRSSSAPEWPAGRRDTIRASCTPVHVMPRPIPVSARECMAENRILRKIMADGLEWNGGLFVGWTEEHVAYLRTFLDACGACEIPARQISSIEARKLEPRLNARSWRRWKSGRGLRPLPVLPELPGDRAAVRRPCENLHRSGRPGPLARKVTVVSHLTGRKRSSAPIWWSTAAGPWTGQGGGPGRGKGRRGGFGWRVRHRGRTSVQQGTQRARAPGGQ